MSLDFSPKPGAAPLTSMIRSQLTMEIRLLARNGEQVLLALVIPLLLLVAGSRSTRIIDLGDGRPIDIITPGVLALAILSTSFTSLAIATGFERRYGVIKRLGASPLPRTGLMAGKMAAVAVVEAFQLVVLCLVAWAIGWEPQGGVVSFLWLALLTLLGTAAFGGLGLLIAGLLRAEATLALANLVYVLLLVGGGILIPLDRYPDGSEAFLRLLPSGALGEGIRDAFQGGAPSLESVVVLLVWAMASGGLAARTFKWE
ncbi:ABC transporter permease [soil metagenome]